MIRELLAYKQVKIGLSIFFAALVLGIVFSNLFITKANEYRVVRQFGEIVRVESEPGFSHKVPFIQTVSSLPKHQMYYDVKSSEINTKDKKRILIDNYAVWKIVDVKDMVSNAKTIHGAETKISEFIFSIVRSELGQMNFDEIINDEKSGRGDLNDRITKQVNDMLKRDQYGVTVSDVRIKRTDLPPENEQSVYTRMISERDSKAQEYLSKGDAEKNRITADTDREVKEMLSKAKAEAEIIRGEGESIAAKTFNDSYSKDLNFYNLYRTLESYEESLGDETVVVLPSDSPYGRILLGYTN